MSITKTKRNAWAWVPSLYFAEGLPYIIVMTVSVIMYKRLGISNAEIGLYTSWLYLPWVIKPLWSPVVDLFKTKRLWVFVMQLIIGAGLAGVAFTINVPNFFQYTLAFFWLMAFSSATHDIAADGFYMLGLPEHEQAFFVGIRSTFYRFAMLTGQGLLVILAGYFENIFTVEFAWSITFSILAGMFVLFFVYHKFILPYPETDKAVGRNENESVFLQFFTTFVLFFKKKKIMVAILFLLLYRLGEGQLAKMAAPFLLDKTEAGGLALSTSEVGLLYGTIGLIALIIGGILGGIAASKNGLKYWIWWMLAAINLPNIVYVFMSYTQPSSFVLISSMIAIEQFGYGFGFTAYMLYMIHISEGNHKTAHYAIATGFMALSMMLPGMISGYVQESVGYQHFFIWVLISTLPIFIITKFIDIDPEFGKKKKS
ncbi:MAG: MFS transporter [Melioribacteraceae bacterium]|nr:MFS transporter [Melioribacteraceae bacterium]MCF8356329.1 MFS transporter [Melioribacteraceae bacterium]MCF8395730.1 MFS transporter [Melioribacteraceae bacterium]MCF8420881.1 MFS transporter [Melioribacteraceae bacterium]